MVKYEYNPELEVFRRVDGKGVPLKVNIVEARRIASLMDLGIKAPTILKKIDFVNKISITTLRTIMNNIEQGNMKLDGDYPLPSKNLYDMDMEYRVSKLEDDMKLLMNRTCECDNGPGIIDKVKLWLKV